MALYVQSLIRQNTISAEFGVKAINVCIKGRIPLDDAFKRLGWTPPETTDEQKASAGELGELLVQSGLLDRSMLEQAQWQGQENNLPLGRCLVLNRMITSVLLQSALTAQVLIRDGKITEEQAIAGLKQAVAKHQSLEQSLVDTGAFRTSAKDSIKLGDLVTQACWLQLKAIRFLAIEIGLSEHQRIGEVFVQTGMISSKVVDDSLRLQEMVTSGALSGLQAADILRQSSARQVSIIHGSSKASGKMDCKVIWDGKAPVLGALSGDNFNGPKSLARQLMFSYGRNDCH